MGLSSKKVKQRIPADPRNLAWADDAAKFGSNYLSKFGWNSSKGLGVDGEGRTSHIKVAHKLNMLGIGAAHQNEPNGIAWKQNMDFESVLKRLNEAAMVEEDFPTSKEDETTVQGEVVIHSEDDEDAKKAKKRKRKRNQLFPSDEKVREKRKKNESDVQSDKAVTLKAVNRPVDVASPPLQAPRPYIPRHRAHRARAIASKSIASKSKASIAEILGIAPSTSSTSISDSGTPVGKLTPLDDGPTLDKITTSTKSLADYFKEKLLTKSLGSMASLTPPSEVNLNTDFEDVSRKGLGSSRFRMGTKAEDVDDQRQNIGITGFPSLLSSTFPVARSSSPAPVESIPDDHIGHELEKRRKKYSRITLSTFGNVNGEEVRRSEEGTSLASSLEEGGRDRSEAKEGRRIRAERKARKERSGKSRTHKK